MLYITLLMKYWLLIKTSRLQVDKHIRGHKNSIRFTHSTRHSYLIPEQIVTSGIYNIETITRTNKGQVKLWNCSITTIFVCYLKSRDWYSNVHFSTSNVGSLVVFFIVITSKIWLNITTDTMDLQTSQLKESAMEKDRHS